MFYYEFVLVRVLYQENRRSFTGRRVCSETTKVAKSS